MTAPRRRPHPAPAADERVPIACCECGKPTSMRVPRDLARRLLIYHLCTRCHKQGRAATGTESSTPGKP